MRRSFTDMDDMLRKKNQPIKRAKQTPGEYDTCNDSECQICSQWISPQSIVVIYYTIILVYDTFCTI